jgi:hypothetical protein
MSNFLRETKNISFDIQPDFSMDELIETKYITGILRNLSNKLGEELFLNTNFHLIFGNQPLPVEHRSEYSTPNVYIISDEYQTIRRGLYKNGNIIFQSFYSEAKFKNLYSKLFAFPLGYNGKVALDNSIQFAERPLNVFFSGNLHRGRRKMYNFYGAFKHLPFSIQHRLQAFTQYAYDNKYENSYIRFTNGFLRGLNYEEYANYIKNSKIVLTPPGSLADECYRHYEAMKCGCVIVSERLPNNHFLSNSPIIQVEDWKEADKIIRDLLANPERMHELHLASLQWWQNVMSEEAVANYMAKIIKKILTECG